jgi:serine/threonine protein kinase
MATGAPPHAELHPLRVLFLIPKDPPPALEGVGFSQGFKDFVAACCRKAPEERPTARELLSHPFIASQDAQAGTRALVTHIQELQVNGLSFSTQIYSHSVTHTHTHTRVPGQKNIKEDCDL